MLCIWVEWIITKLTIITFLLIKQNTKLNLMLKNWYLFIVLKWFSVKIWNFKQLNVLWIFRYITFSGIIVFSSILFMLLNILLNYINSSIMLFFHNNTHKYKFKMHMYLLNLKSESNNQISKSNTVQLSFELALQILQQYV